MLDRLENIDRATLIIINRDLSSSAFDLFFPWMTDLHKNIFFSGIFIPLVILLTIYVHKKRGALLVLGLVVTIAIDDFIGGKVIKPLFARPRPTLAGLDLILRAPEYGGYSFTSNHSANMFCLATFVAFFFPKSSYVFFVLAALTAYSRVYVGVHYPLDVIGGAALGIGVGWIGGAFTKRKLKWQ